MKEVSPNKVRNLRKERNADVLKRMKNGETLSSFNSLSSWYPPRPVIGKDDRAIRALYGRTTDQRLRVAHAKQTGKNEGVNPSLELA